MRWRLNYREPTYSTYPKANSRPKDTSWSRHNHNVGLVMIRRVKLKPNPPFRLKRSRTRKYRRTAFQKYIGRYYLGINITPFSWGDKLLVTIWCAWLFCVNQKARSKRAQYRPLDYSHPRIPLVLTKDLFFNINKVNVFFDALLRIHSKPTMILLA